GPRDRGPADPRRGARPRGEGARRRSDAAPGDRPRDRAPAPAARRQCPARSRPPAGPRRRRRGGEADRAGRARHVRTAAREDRDRETGCVAGDSRPTGYKKPGNDTRHEGNPHCPAPSRKKGEVMKALRWLVIVLVVAGCTDRALMSPPAPQASLIGDLLGATGLLQCSDLAYASTTQTIGSAGGVIRVGPHTLSIPAGALSAPVAITGALVTGRGVNAVHFEPEGLTFARSASLTMSYANCNLLGRLLP